MAIISKMIVGTCLFQIGTRMSCFFTLLKEKLDKFRTKLLCHIRGLWSHSFIPALKYGEVDRSLDTNVEDSVDCAQGSKDTA